jgi:phosphoketolase
VNADELRKTAAFWRACNYLSLGMIYLQGNVIDLFKLQPDSEVLHVRGYQEKGNINTPMELGAHAKERYRNMQIECRHYAYENGIDSPAVSDWTWPY